MRDRHRPPVPLPPAPHRGGRFPAGPGGGHPPLPPARALSPAARAGGRGPADPAAVAASTPSVCGSRSTSSSSTAPASADLDRARGPAEPRRPSTAAPTAVLELPAARRARRDAARSPSRGRPWSSARTTRRPWSCSATTSRPTASRRCRRRGRRRAAALPLQAARPAAARSQPPRRLGARGAARDPRHRGRHRELRPGAAGDRAQRSRQPTPTASAGCECGADDYVVKPFAIGEVVARMRAVLRRRDGRRAGPLRVGEIFVDPSRREVSSRAASR